MRNYIVFICLALAAQGIMAQKTVYYAQPENLFNRGKEIVS